MQELFLVLSSLSEGENVALCRIFHCCINYFPIYTSLECLNVKTVLQLNTARIMMTKILLPFSWQRKKLISLPVHENVTSFPDQCFALTSIAFTRLMLCPDFHCFYQILFFIVVLAAAFLTSFIDSSGFCIFSVILSLTVRCTSRDHTFQEIFICV